jgi:solute carrier family 39 (zinc transporter), member 1/2/3
MTFYIISIVLLAFAALGGIMLSQTQVIHKPKNNFIYYGEGFSAGIFLGASLLHMLPDAIHHLQMQISTWEYPVASLLCAAGFLVLYLIEKIGHACLHKKNDDQLTASAMTYLLLIILSIHSLLVGLSIGFEMHQAAAIIIVLAIFIHKASAGFALGVSMRRSQLTFMAIILMASIFALATPVGVLIGVGSVLWWHFHVSALAEGLFDALAAGTFLFMAMHFTQTSGPVSLKTRLISICMLIIGFIIMAILALFL